MLMTGTVADNVKAVYTAVKDKNKYFHDSIFRGVLLANNKSPIFKDVDPKNFDAARKTAYEERMKKMPALDASVRQAADGRGATIRNDDPPGQELTANESQRRYRGATELPLRGSITRLWHSLSTLHSAGLLRHRQDSLAAAGHALPHGLDYPQGSIERFQLYSIHSILLSQAFPDAAWHGHPFRSGGRKRFLTGS